MEVSPDGTAVVTTKVGDGHAGFPRTMKHVAHTEVHRATREETNRFRAQVEKLSFWTLDGRDPGAVAGTDGDFWVIEGLKNGNYRAVDAQAVERLGLMLAFEIGHTKLQKD